MNARHKTRTSMLLILMATVFAQVYPFGGQTSAAGGQFITETDHAALNMLPVPSESDAPAASALSSTVHVEALYRFETREEWTGGQFVHPITETEGRAFTSDYAIGPLVWIYDAQDGESLTWQFTRPDGSTRFTGTVTYDLETDCWTATNGGWYCGDPDDPYMMDRGFIWVIVIDSSDVPGVSGGDPPGSWTVNVLHNGGQIYSEQFELVPVPKLKIDRAAMVSPNELGIGLTVEYPDHPAYQGRPRYLRFSATINGMPVEPDIPVDGFIQLGTVWGEGPVLDPGNCIKIDLTDWDPQSDEDNPVPRFTQNQNFQLTGVAYCPNIEPHLKSKEQPPVQVDILLPVVILHGYVNPDGYPISWLGPWSAPISYWYAYEQLSDFLVNIAGYYREDTWDGGSSPSYRTLWDPEPGALYRNPRGALPSEIVGDIDGLLSDVQEHSYASKVNLIGHSFGGLVARYYAEVRSENVNKVITVGAPHKGQALFFKLAFSSSKAEFETECPEQSPLRWAVPDYTGPYLYQKIKNEKRPLDPLSIVNTLPGAAGARYWSIYNSRNKRTPKSLFVVPTTDWYQGKRYYEYGLGDGEVLTESAGGFGTPCPISSRESHARLCNDIGVQSEILRILIEE